MSDQHVPSPASRVLPQDFGLPEDLVWAIFQEIVEPLSPIYEEEDAARDAASCLCGGHPLFTRLGELIYNYLSPHLNAEIQLTENSTMAQMTEVLKVGLVGIFGD